MSNTLSLHDALPISLTPELTAGPLDHAAPVSSAPGSTRLPDDLAVFAALVRETARGVPTGRFGEKIFIVHVWRALVAAGRAGAGDEAAFKERLVRAHVAGLLGLARADLTGAFDPVDVAGSVVPYLNATFHFLRLD